MSTRSSSLRRAGKMALDGDEESQDSQAVMDAYIRAYGVDIMTTSSPAPGDVFALHAQKQSSLHGGESQKKKAKARADWSPSRGATPPQLDEIPDTQNTRDVNVLDRSYPLIEGVEGRRTRSQPGDDCVHELSAQVPLKKKMDSSQSPTQSNHGRSYDQFAPTSSPGRALPNDDAQSSPKLPPTSSHERTLKDDDTGAVNLNLDNFANSKSISSVPDDSGFVDFRSLARLRNLASEDHAPKPFQEFPETPAPPQNPFRQSRSQLLAPSQLFGSTQFSSAVKHIASPTSSRPSPNDFNHNSISPNVAISSPLKARGLRSTPIPNPTSSPQILPGTTSSALRDRASSPDNSASTKTAAVPESPQPVPGRKRSAPEPLATYEPMHKSQERRSSSVLRSSPVDSEEDDDDESIARRMKARSKKEAALRQLTAINFTRPPKSDDIEVPSTNKRKAKHTAKPYPTQRPSNPPENINSDGHDTVADSQEHLVRDAEPQLARDDEPTQSDAEQDSKQEPKLASTKPMDLPPTINSLTQINTAAAINETPIGDAIPETSPTDRRLGTHTEHNMSPPSLPLQKTQSAPVFHSSPPALSTRSRRANPKGIPSSSTSTLSNLASTPQISSSITPATVDSASSKPSLPAQVSTNSSPAVAKSKRREAHGTLSKIKTGSAESLRQSARLGRHLSSSADELSRSDSTTPTFEQSLRISRLSMIKSSHRAVSKSAVQHSQRPIRLFEGMAFAISFQSKKAGESNDHYSVRIESAVTIEKRIKQAGGRILHNSFDELFETSPSKAAAAVGPVASALGTTQLDTEIRLTAAGQATGFTALIADGHSRKVKYMQALALGLPCIAPQWITACLDKNEVVDWTSYLLCAGQSAFLGDAIRSRSLMPYDAATATLREVVGRRRKLLEGSRILLVMKKGPKGGEGKKMAYVFLARVLGAELRRVYSVEEARAEMRRVEKEKEEEGGGGLIGFMWMGSKVGRGCLLLLLLLLLRRVRPRLGRRGRGGVVVRKGAGSRRQRGSGL
ncbi:hypothetical protein B0T17DRAFT_625722 [Bombardia bombarda]|uniref:BRCT domain-containing protein n=1 Tax=Bombardia bombarda TaxID=252184 RepID=A0AA39XN21_9PEZI|nr:hypothetical protein B0T17DRAFT_625722 [Bombardia bombarda]